MLLRGNNNDAITPQSFRASAFQRTLFVNAHLFFLRSRIHSCRGWSKRRERHSNLPWRGWPLAQLPDRGGRLARSLGPRSPAGVGVLFHASARGFGNQTESGALCHCVPTNAAKSE